jgi:DNA-binding CsgD family transcriptional regulator
VTPTSSGRSTPEGAAPARSLADHVGDDRYVLRVSEVVEQIDAAPDEAGLHRLLRQGVAALGAERAAFVTFVRGESELASCRWMLDCEPDWCRRYLDRDCFSRDPWVAYAARESEPVVASALNIVDPAQREVVALAAEAGFASAVLVPAHSGAGHARVSLLCLGHADPGYFEAGGIRRLRVGARALALELHDWWLARIRRDLLLRSRITRDDLTLLEHQCLGHSSKRIAAELNMSRTSVNSRFQRLIAKLGVANRKMAARLAIECGLIVR